MKVFRFLLIFIIILVVLAAGLFYTQFSAPKSKSEEERFIVRMETSEGMAVDDLFKQGLLKNKNAFNFALSFACWQKKTCPERSPEPDGTWRSRRITPGAYRLSKNMNAFQLVEKLLLGPYQKWVVIPPGKRKEQVALILQKSLNWQFSVARAFINDAQEGYLYPDTYLINVDYTPEDVWLKLQSNFNDHFDAEIQKSLLSQNIRNDTAIKIASLIERESGGAEDKPIIAGIIWNRLLKGMRLEIDATVQYAIATEKLNESGLQTLNNFTFWQTLGSGVVRKIDSPYNTYLNDGLPPGPICSPSIDSIKAVAYPAETDALYYLHSSDKKIHTAKTYEEHLENINIYLK